MASGTPYTWSHSPIDYSDHITLYERKAQVRIGTDGKVHFLP